MSDAAWLGVPVRVETREITPGRVAQVLAALERARGVVDGGYAFFFDPRSGHVVLQAEAERTAFQSVDQAFPGLVEQSRGIVRPAGWSNDTSNFKGGAWLDGALLCTSGFTAIKNGVKRIVTAGHCNPDEFMTNMGRAETDVSVYPDWDLQEIVAGNGYVGGIYDSSLNTRPVTNAANPSVGSMYCTSGRSTGFKCSWELESTGVTICYTQGGYPGCAHDLVGFHRETSPYHVEGGDSGGPLWFKYANGGAGIRGVISGYFFDFWTVGGAMSYATPYSIVHTKLGVSAVLLPAPPP